MKINWIGWLSRLTSNITDDIIFEKIGRAIPVDGMKKSSNTSWTKRLHW